MPTYFTDIICLHVFLYYLQIFPVQNVIRRTATPYRYPGDSVSTH